MLAPLAMVYWHPRKLLMPGITLSFSSLILPQSSSSISDGTYEWRVFMERLQFHVPTSILILMMMRTKQIYYYIDFNKLRNLTCEASFCLTMVQYLCMVGLAAIRTLFSKTEATLVPTSNGWPICSSFPSQAGPIERWRSIWTRPFAARNFGEDPK